MPTIPKTLSLQFAVRLSLLSFTFGLGAGDAGDKPVPRMDRYGDPLPPGAIDRLGTLRWRHASGPMCAAFSPDGKRLATGARDGSVSVCDMATGKEVHRFEREIHLLDSGDRPVTGVAFSPDGKLLASTGSERDLFVWSDVTGRVVHRFDTGRMDRCAFAFSPDGAVLAHSAIRHPTNEDPKKDDSGWEIHVHAMATGKEVGRIRCPDAIISALVFSTDGKLLITGHQESPSRREDGDKPDGDAVKPPPPPRKRVPSIQLWETATWKHRGTLGDPEPQVHSLAICADGRTLAVGGFCKRVRLWDVAAAKEVRCLEAGTRDKARQAKMPMWEDGSVAVAFSADGKSLITACADQTVLIWDPQTGKEIRQHPDTYCKDIAVSSDGHFLLSGGSLLIRPMELTTGKPVVEPEGHDGGVSSLSVSPDGRSLLSASRSALIWSLDGGKPKPPRPFPGYRTAAFSPDGKTIACAGDQDYLLLVYDRESGKELHRFEACSQGLMFSTTFAFSPDGKRLMAETDHRIGMWDVATGKPIEWAETEEDRDKAFRHGVREQATAIVFSPDGKTIAWASRHSLMCLFEPGPKLTARSFNHIGAEAVAFSPDGKWLVAIGGRNADHKDKSRIRIWDTASGRELMRFAPDLNGMHGLAISPGGKLLATSGEDGLIRLWDPATGKELRQWRGHQGGVGRLAFLPDGKTLASGGNDGTILLWSVAELIKQ